MAPSCLFRKKHKFLSILCKALHPSGLTFLPTPPLIFAPGTPNCFCLPSPLLVGPCPHHAASLSQCLCVCSIPGLECLSSQSSLGGLTLRFSLSPLLGSLPRLLLYYYHTIGWVKGASALILGPLSFHPTDNNCPCLHLCPLGAPGLPSPKVERRVSQLGSSLGYLNSTGKSLEWRGQCFTSSSQGGISMGLQVRSGLANCLRWRMSPSRVLL